ncbi:MAG: arginine--tRNA ligase [Anaerolineales bacterium]|nr:arginine--tRNA ligase [Anaerolineales bacterium]
MFSIELDAATEKLLALLEANQYPLPGSVDWTPIPFRSQWGFGTAVCFQVAAAEARSGKQVHVPSRAKEISEHLSRALDPLEGFETIEAANGYINLYINKSVYSNRVVNTVLENATEFGRGEPKDAIVMVEYAQPNTHHSFHIGHARTAILGEALARLVSFGGYPTIRASYPGDIGLGVITCIWAYDRFFKGQEPDGVHERGQWLAKIYTEATRLLTPREDETEEERAQREAYDAERRALYKAWDAGEPAVRELWQETRQWSLDELDAILQILGIEIDVFFFESEVDEPSKRIVDELIEQGIAEDERPEGPVIVKIDEKLGLDQEQYRTAVILRSDGTTLYSTKDLALAKVKFEDYDVDRSIYVVDVRQSLHFQQVFKILELWGFPQAKDCFHLAYGFVTLPEGAMSSRAGNVVLFMDVLEEAERRVQDVIAEKNPDLPGKERDRVVRQVGLGALQYSMLSVDNNKDIVFNWDDALSFEGQSAPYIQNAHVRASSILKRAGEIPEESGFEYEMDPTEIELIDKISQFPSTVQRAAEDYKPLLMATYAYELARTFHLFYHAARVIQADDPAVRASRIRLTAAAKQTLANALALLGIQAPAAM